MTFLGRSMMCPTDARTSKPLPKYFSIVFALAGDSTITNDLLIAILDFVLLYPIVPSHPSNSIHRGAFFDSQRAPTLSCSCIPFSQQLSRESQNFREPFCTSGQLRLLINGCKLCKLPRNRPPFLLPFDDSARETALAP